MLRPAGMRHVLIETLSECLPQLALELARSGSFHPDYRVSDEHELTDIPGDQYRQLYQTASSRLEKICAHWIESIEIHDDGSRVPDVAELKEINAQLGDLWTQCSQCQEQLRRLDDEEKAVDQLEANLAKFRNLNVDLSRLQGDDRFLVVRIGVLLRANQSHLEEALGLAGFILYPFLSEGERVHVIALGPRGDSLEHVDRVLESAGFQDLPVPDELNAPPDKAAQALAARRAQLASRKQEREQHLQDETARNRDFLAYAKRSLALAEPFVQLGSAARCSQRIGVVSGWVPVAQLPALEARLDGNLPYPVQINGRRPHGPERGAVPTLLSPNRLLSPFTTLVTQYGVPRYGEINPSGIFAVTFILMFGMMFGDIGHGAMFVLVALLLRRRLGRFTTFGVAAGCASMVFGALYGSVFGFEELLHPLWQSPLTDPVLMLQIALIWGVGFLLLMNVMSIYNRLMEQDWPQAILGNHGMVSITLYLGLLWGGWNLYHGSGLGLWPALLLTASLAALAGFKWVESELPVGERVMVVLVETFEAITSSMSATLSFLRVAAFSLNHVALAIAVFTLADMLEPVGHWVTVVLGNLFILVLEGGIVLIQALRLEYYEGFTRFYSGDGHAFQPLRLDLKPAATGGDNTSAQQGVTA
jgi:V/A-type H+-transporting ATPase subunit I